MGLCHCRHESSPTTVVPETSASPQRDGDCSAEERVPGSPSMRVLAPTPSAGEEGEGEGEGEILILRQGEDEEAPPASQPQEGPHLSPHSVPQPDPLRSIRERQEDGEEDNTALRPQGGLPPPNRRMRSSSMPPRRRPVQLAPLSPSGTTPRGRVSDFLFRRNLMASPSSSSPGGAGDPRQAASNHTTVRATAGTESGSQQSPLLSPILSPEQLQHRAVISRRLDSAVQKVADCGGGGGSGGASSSAPRSLFFSSPSTMIPVGAGVGSWLAQENRTVRQHQQQHHRHHHHQQQQQQQRFHHAASASSGALPSVGPQEGAEVSRRYARSEMPGEGAVGAGNPSSSNSISSALGGWGTTPGVLQVQGPSAPTSDAPEPEEEMVTTGSDEKSCEHQGVLLAGLLEEEEEEEENESDEEEMCSHGVVWSRGFPCPECSHVADQVESPPLTPEELTSATLRRLHEYVASNPPWAGGEEEEEEKEHGQRVSVLDEAVRSHLRALGLKGSLTTLPQHVLRKLMLTSSSDLAGPTTATEGTGVNTLVHQALPEKDERAAGILAGRTRPSALEGFRRQQGQLQQRSPQEEVGEDGEHSHHLSSEPSSPALAPHLAHTSSADTMTHHSSSLANAMAHGGQSSIHSPSLDTFGSVLHHHQPHQHHHPYAVALGEEQSHFALQQQDWYNVERFSGQGAGAGLGEEGVEEHHHGEEAEFSSGTASLGGRVRLKPQQHHSYANLPRTQDGSYSGRGKSQFDLHSLRELQQQQQRGGVEIRQLRLTSSSGGGGRSGRRGSARAHHHHHPDSGKSTPRMRFSRKGLEDLREASAKLGPQPRQHKSILGELRPRFHVGESGGSLGGGSGHRHRQHAHPGAAPVALRSVEHSPSAEEVRLHAQQQQQQQQEQEHDAESPWGGVQSHASSSHFSHASQSSVGTADFLTAEVRRRPRRGSSSLHAEALSDRGQGSSSWTVQHQQREQQHEHEQEDLDAPLSGQEDVASTLSATSAAITSHSGSSA